MFKEHLPEDLIGKECVIGTDLSLTRGRVATVLLFHWRDADGLRHYAVFPRYFIPGGSLAEHYSRMNPSTITAVSGSAIGFEAIASISRAILDDVRKYKVAAVTYDPFDSPKLGAELALDKGLDVIEFSRSPSSMKGALKLLATAFSEGRMDFSLDPVLGRVLNDSGIEGSIPSYVALSSHERAAGEAALTALSSAMFAVEIQETRRMEKTEGITAILPLMPLTIALGAVAAGAYLALRPKPLYVLENTPRFKDAESRSLYLRSIKRLVPNGRVAVLEGGSTLRRVS